MNSQERAVIEAAKKVTQGVVIPSEGQVAHHLKYDEHQALMELIDAVHALREAGEQGDASCPVCCGKPISPKPCICGGTGNAQDAYMNLLEEHNKPSPAEAVVREMLAELEADRKRLLAGADPTKSEDVDLLTWETKTN
jgi:hypothetical protein